MRTMLIAVGGNSLIRAGETGTIAEQRVNAVTSEGGPDIAYRPRHARNVRPVP